MAPISAATLGLMPRHEPPYLAITILPFTSMPRRASSS